MTEAKFVEKHNKTWKALETALKSPGKSFNDIEERINLYRAVSGHLSYAQSAWGSGTLYSYLSELTSKAHAQIYANSDKEGVKAFLLKTIPRQIRASILYISVSAGLFIAAALLSFGLTIADPGFAYAFLPEQYIDAIPADDAGITDTDAGWAAPVMSSFIMVNNIRVSVLAFGLGLTCGVGTVYVLATNGFMLGSLAAVYASKGGALLFWSLILPHGIWELTAIFIAGGAGLLLGYSLIRPGVFRRRDALLSAARSISGLVVLIVFLLACAGIIEGFFTPSNVDPVIKLVFAAVTAIVLAIFFMLVWRFTEAPVSKKDNA